MKKDEYRLLAPLYGMLVEPLAAQMRKLASHVVVYKPGKRVLDIGCGTGTYLQGLAAKGCFLAGVDLSPSMLRTAREKLEPRISLCSADCGKLPFCDESFDIVNAQFLIHEIDPPFRQVIMIEMARVLKKKGSIVIADYYNRPKIWPKGLLAVATIMALEMLAGVRHCRAFLSYISSGAMDPVFKKAGLHVIRSTVKSRAPAAIWVAQKNA